MMNDFNVNVVPNWLSYMTLLIAAAALIPWVVRLVQWGLARKKSNILIMPNKVIDIFFGERGVGILSYITLVPKSIEAIIMSVKVTITKGDETIYRLESENFYSPYNESYSGVQGMSLQRNVSTPAHPLSLTKNNSMLQSVMFYDYNIREKVETYISNRDDLIRQCKFEAGEYVLVFEAIDSNLKSYKNLYTMTINESDVKSLQQNVDKIMSRRSFNVSYYNETEVRECATRLIKNGELCKILSETEIKEFETLRGDSNEGIDIFGAFSEHHKYVESKIYNLCDFQRYNVITVSVSPATRRDNRS